MSGGVNGRQVNFGLWYDFRNPAGGPFEGLYRANLDQIVWAESLGFDSVWLTEHHFCADGYTPSPLVIAAAIGERTRRMRIGTNLMLLPFHERHAGFQMVPRTCRHCIQPIAVAVQHAQAPEQARLARLPKYRLPLAQRPDRRLIKQPDGRQQIAHAATESATIWSKAATASSNKLY